MPCTTGRHRHPLPPPKYGIPFWRLLQLVNEADRFAENIGGRPVAARCYLTMLRAYLHRWSAQRIGQTVIKLSHVGGTIVDL